MPLWTRYYDKAGELARTMDVGDYKILGGRTVPAVMGMVPADKPNERTTMIYDELAFDISMS